MPNKPMECIIFTKMKEILKSKVFIVKIRTINLKKNFKEIYIEEIIEVGVGEEEEDEEITIIIFHTNINNKDNINKNYIIILVCQTIKNYQIKIFNLQMKVLKTIQRVKKVITQ